MTDNIDLDATRAFGSQVVSCPKCGHGIDPHGDLRECDYAIWRRHSC